MERFSSRLAQQLAWPDFARVTRAHLNVRQIYPQQHIVTDDSTKLDLPTQEDPPKIEHLRP